MTTTTATARCARRGARRQAALEQACYGLPARNIDLRRCARPGPCNGGYKATVGQGAARTLRPHPGRS